MINNLSNETLVSLVDRVTDPSVDEQLGITADLVGRIKRECRGSDASIQATFKLLFKKLKADDSRVRSLALDVVAELFQRSRLFRTLLAGSKFPRFVELVIGFKDSCALPPPTEAATRLRAKGLELIEEWDMRHGTRLPAITIAHRFLRDTLGFRFPEIDARQAAVEEATRQREAIAQTLAQNQFQLLCQGWESRAEDSRSLLQQFNAAYTLYIEKDEEYNKTKLYQSSGDIQHDDPTEVEWEDVHDPPLGSAQPRQHEAVEEDDGALLQSLHDTVTLIRTQALPSMHEALRIAVRGGSGTGEGERILRAATELKQSLSSAVAKYEERRLDLAALSQANKRRRAQQQQQVQPQAKEKMGLGSLEQAGCTRIQSSQAFPPGVLPVEEEPKRSTFNPYDYIRDPTMPNAKEGQQSMNHHAAPGAATTSGAPQTSAKVSREVLKSLAAKAPVLPTGPYVRVWDSVGRDVPQYVSGSGLEVSNHWGPVDVHQQLPAERMEEFFLYQPNQERQKKSAVSGSQGHKGEVKRTEKAQGRGGGGGGGGEGGARSLESAIASISSTLHGANASGGGGGGGGASRLRAAERSYNDAIVSHMTAMSRQYGQDMQGFEGVGGQREARSEGGNDIDAGKGKRKGKTLSVRERLEKKIKRRGKTAELEELGLQDAERRRDRFGNRWEEK